MKKVAIVAGGPSRGYARMFKESNPDGEVWLIPVAAPEFQDIADRAFEMHPYKEFRNIGPGGLYLKDLRKMTCPIYMIEQHPSFPMAIEYPVKKMVAQYGPVFPGTIAYMMALAIDEGFDEMHLFGCDISTDEYKDQRPSAEYFVGYAQGKGMKVFIPEESTLLNYPKLYGYEQ